jgi:hypothetical protein
MRRRSYWPTCEPRPIANPLPDRNAVRRETFLPGTYSPKEAAMARIGRQISLIAAVWLASSALVALAQSGGSSGGGASSSAGGAAGGGTSSGTAGGPSAGTSGTGTSGSTAPGTAGRIGPGGAPMAPGPSGSNIPGQQAGPGGAPIAPGSSEGLNSPPVPPGETRGSGRPQGAWSDCPPSGSASAARAGLGPPARIMADEPGRRGQSTGADASAGTIGVGSPSNTPTAGATSATTGARARDC